MSEHQVQPEYGDEQADADEMSRLTRDGTAEPLSRDQIIRRVRGQGNTHFPCSADHEQDWQPVYPVDPYSCYMYVMTIHIPSNIRGYQSGSTWSAGGQEKIRGTSTKLQRGDKNKTKTTKRKEQ